MTGIWSPYLCKLYLQCDTVSTGLFAFKYFRDGCLAAPGEMEREGGSVKLKAGERRQREREWGEEVSGSERAREDRVGVC